MDNVFVNIIILPMLNYFQLLYDYFHSFKLFRFTLFMVTFGYFTLGYFWLF